MRPLTKGIPSEYSAQQKKTIRLKPGCKAMSLWNVSDDLEEWNIWNFFGTGRRTPHGALSRDWQSRSEERDMKQTSRQRIFGRFQETVPCSGHVRHHLS